MPAISCRMGVRKPVDNGLGGSVWNIKELNSNQKKNGEITAICELLLKTTEDLKGKQKNPTKYLETSKEY